MRWVSLAWLAALATACGEPESSTDGGADSSVDAPAVAPPDIPWLDDGEPPIEVVLTPCPEGWREVVVDSITQCDPYPESGPASCGPGEGHFAGEPGCRPVGDPCPSGEFADGLPSSEVIYVLAGSAPGGDGSRAAPFAALSEVIWSTLRAGTTVALGRGSYEGSLPLRAGVSVIGACAAETIVTGTTAPVRAVITTTSPGDPSRIANVTIADAPQPGVVVTNGHLVLDGVVIERVQTVAIGIQLATAHVELADVVLRDIVPSATDEAVGVVNREGALLEADHLVVEGMQKGGLFAEGADARLVLRDVTVHDTRAGGGLGHSITVQTGASLELDRAWLEGSHGTALLLKGDVTARLADVVIRDVRRAPGTRAARGISIENASRVTAQRVSISGCDEVGVGVLNEGTTFDVEGLVLRDMLSSPEGGPGGRGLSVEDGAVVTGDGIAVLHTYDVAVLIGDNVSSASLTNVSILDARPDRSLESFGLPLAVQETGTLTLSNAKIDGGHVVGVYVQRGSHADFTDVVVRNTLPQVSDHVGGRAINVGMESTLRAERMLIENVQELGIFAESLGASVSLVDVVVRDVSPNEFDLSGGRGINVQSRVQLDMERVEIARTFEAGLTIMSDSTVTGSNVSIHDVSRSACSGDGCRYGVLGNGMSVHGASVDLSDFVVRGAETCGVYVGSLRLSSFPQVNLRDGVVEESTIGACVAVDGFDVSSLVDGVEYRDNDTNLQADALPVPDPTIDSSGLSF